jgi:hypothetical protein
LTLITDLLATAATSYPLGLRFGLLLSAPIEVFGSDR